MAACGSWSSLESLLVEPGMAGELMNMCSLSADDEQDGEDGGVSTESPAASDEVEEEA